MCEYEQCHESEAHFNYVINYMVKGGDTIT